VLSRQPLHQNTRRAHVILCVQVESEDVGQWQCRTLSEIPDGSDFASFLEVAVDEALTGEAGNARVVGPDDGWMDVGRAVIRLAEVQNENLMKPSSGDRLHDGAFKTQRSCCKGFDPVMINFEGRGLL
jgi:hypothetical protein